MEEQRVGGSQHQCLRQQQERDTTHLVEGVEEKLRQPALVIEGLTGSGIGEAIHGGNLPLRGDYSPGGEMPPEVVWWDGDEERAEGHQRKRSDEPDLIQRGPQSAHRRLSYRGFTARHGARARSATRQS